MACSSKTGVVRTVTIRVHGDSLIVHRRCFGRDEEVFHITSCELARINVLSAMNFGEVNWASVTKFNAGPRRKARIAARLDEAIET